MSNFISIIDTCSFGGKAQGLTRIGETLASEFDRSLFPDIEVSIPSMTIICTDVFDAFMERNNLYEIAHSDAQDDRIAHSFQRADLPFEILGELRTLISGVHIPLAIRSSSMLEDSTHQPFAGVYATKMIPNNQFDPDVRFRKLTEAIKFVYASTFFQSAKGYLKAAGYKQEDEKMAVIIQELVGKRYTNRFYPELSGVVRSYNFYPIGRAKNEDGVVHLALGLGKTIVDGDVTWSYSPAYPAVSPPFRSIGDLLKSSQNKYWAVNMGEPPAYDPIKETEFLTHENLMVAEEDNTLRYVASTFDMQSGRLSAGVSRSGPRVITFAPLLVLKQAPLNDLIKTLLSMSESALNAPVEIEFAMSFNPHKFGFLQVRPMVVSSQRVDVKEEELKGEQVLVASGSVLGNGVANDICDIVYVEPESFDPKHSRQIAQELERLNKNLVAKERPYLLIVFGRLGSFDTWLGIPVDWGQIAGARVIVEATQQNIRVELSQGSHFFHNLINLGVSYFSIPFLGDYQIDWTWLAQQKAEEETRFLRHIRVTAPLLVIVDGRCGRGVIYKPSSEST